VELTQRGPKERGAYLQWLGGKVPLRRGENLIGRDPACPITLYGGEVSRRHARIVVSGEETAILEDLSSKNGTLLNGMRVTSAAPLSPGDVIEIGGVALSFHGWLDLSTLTQADLARANPGAKSVDKTIAADTTREAPPPRTR
jgi:pSer/pThr/pTyr-binding forkhead associated (FHA) protein